MVDGYANYEVVKGNIGCVIVRYGGIPVTRSAENVGIRLAWRSAQRTKACLTSTNLYLPTYILQIYPTTTTTNTILNKSQAAYSFHGNCDLNSAKDVSGIRLPAIEINHAD
jgi:hypothetical protein